MHSTKGSRWLHARLRRCVLFIVVAVLAVTTSAPAADRADYTPPKGGVYSMEAHFAWCGEAKTAAERLRRYEKFWEMQHPDNDDAYDDARHVRVVRQCGYRLAQLYAETGRSKECVRMLKWLEKEDDLFDVESSTE